MRQNKNAIVIVSVGDRSWIGEVADLAARYAARCNADLIIERDAPSFAEFPLKELADTPGRPNKRVYSLKTFFAWKHLQESGYSRVLVLDDTCCISTTAPDIFALSGDATVLYTTTGKGDAEKSFADIQRFIRKKNLEDIVYEHSLYMNSGVLLYDTGMKDAISPDKVVAASDLLFSGFPHQSLTYYLLRAGHVSQKAVDLRFNRVPAVSLEKDIRRHMTDIRAYVDTSVFIQHVTGMYYHRDILIPQVCEVIRAQTCATEDPSA